MFLTTRLGFAAAGTLLALNTASIPACADDLIQNLGPVGPYHTILTEVGSKSIIAFYELNSGHCDFRAIVWDTTDVNAESAARFRADLNPLQRVHIDTPENKSIELQCGDNAESLAIVDAEKLAAVGEAK
jgi:hypothetical protein